MSLEALEDMNSTVPSMTARALRRLEGLAIGVASKLQRNRFFAETAGSQVPIDFHRWFHQRVLGKNGTAYWPMHPTSTVSFARRVHVGIETSPGWSPGCYIQGLNGIFVGDYTQIAPNVGIISSNHDVYDLSCHLNAPPILIGSYCLLGMNSVVLPGVRLGNYTIVGANSVVSKSFPEGHCVIVGSPAKVVKRLDPALCRDYSSKKPYHGYIPAHEFADFKRKFLDAPDWPDD